MDWGLHYKEKYERELAEIRAAEEALAQAPTQVRLKRIRRNLRLSQRRLAQVLGVSIKTLQGWEQGRPVPKPVFILAELLRDFPVVRRKLLLNL